MKQKIFVFFSCMLIFINVLAVPIYASASTFDLNNTDSYYSAVGSDLRNMSGHDLYYAKPNTSSGPNSGYTRSLEFLEQISGVLIGYTSSNFFILYCESDTPVLNLTYDDSSFTITSDAPTGYYTCVISNYKFIQTYNASYGSSPSFSRTMRFDYNELVIAYSDYDVYNGDYLIYKRDADPFELNNYIDTSVVVTYNPELSLDMNFKETLIGAGKDEYGNRVDIEQYVYNITGRVHTDGSSTYQYFVVVTDEPPNVTEVDYVPSVGDLWSDGDDERHGISIYGVDFQDVISKSLYTALHDTTYWVLPGNPNYSELDLKKYIQAKGQLAWYASSPTSDSAFTIDLSFVKDFEEGKPYYISVCGFNVSDLVIAAGAIDFGSKQFMASNIPFSMSAFNGSMSEYITLTLADCTMFSVAEGQLIDYENFAGAGGDIYSPDSGISSDDALSGGITPSSAVEVDTVTGLLSSLDSSSSSSIGSISDFSSLISSTKSVIPFFKDVINCFPSEYANLIWLSILLVLTFILTAVVIVGIKFIVSLFS